MFKKTKSRYPTLFLLFITVSNFSCDFAYKKHLTGNYYLIGADSNEDLSLTYKLGSGDFVGKVPGIILEYGFNDTILVAKTRNSLTTNPFFYIIDMTKDYDLALDENFRVGPVSEIDYNKIWKPRLNIILTKVQE